MFIKIQQYHVQTNFIKGILYHNRGIYILLTDALLLVENNIPFEEARIMMEFILESSGLKLYDFGISFIDLNKLSNYIIINDSIVTNFYGDKLIIGKADKLPKQLKI